MIIFQPQIFKEDLLDGTGWKCKKCNVKQNQHLKESKKSMVKLNIRKVCSGRDKPIPPPENTTKLPYDVNYLYFYLNP